MSKTGSTPRPGVVITGCRRFQSGALLPFTYFPSRRVSPPGPPVCLSAPKHRPHPHAMSLSRPRTPSSSPPCSPPHVYGVTPPSRRRVGFDRGRIGVQLLFSSTRSWKGGRRIVGRTRPRRGVGCVTGPMSPTPNFPRVLCEGVSDL